MMPMLGLILIDRNFFSDVEDFSWQHCVLFAFVYTGLTLIPLLISDKVRPDLSNIRPRPAILIVHAVFLAILMGVMQIAAYIAPFLPSGMIEPNPNPGRGQGSSTLDFLFLLLLAVLGIVERGWLFRYLLAPEDGLSSTSVNERD